VRLLARVFVAFLLLLWPVAVATGQTAPAEASQPTFTYTAPLLPAAHAYDHIERGPTLTRIIIGASTDQRAVEGGSHGTSAHPRASATAVTYTYDGTAQLVQVAEGTEVGIAARADRSGVAANAGAHALPKALSGGAADTYVYFGSRNGKNVYTGISNNVGRRTSQHGDRFDGLRQMTDAPVTRGQARSIEQALIVRNPGFQNVRNSISPNHPYYDDAVSLGESWLKQNGF
jgi:hypothetical protein